MDWSYIAGFFDGEGSVIKNYNQTGRPYPYLSWSNTNKEVLDRVCEFLIDNNIRAKVNHWANGDVNNHGWKDKYWLTVYDKESVLTCIYAMHPHLIIKVLDVEWAWEVLEGVVSRKNLRPIPSGRGILPPLVS